MHGGQNSPHSFIEASVNNNRERTAGNTVCCNNSNHPRLGVRLAGFRSPGGGHDHTPGREGGGALAAGCQTARRGGMLWSSSLNQPLSCVFVTLDPPVLLYSTPHFSTLHTLRVVVMGCQGVQGRRAKASPRRRRPCRWGRNPARGRLAALCQLRPLCPLCPWCPLFGETALGGACLKRQSILRSTTSDG